MTSLPDSSENLSTGERLAEIAERIAETVAGPAAYDVDLQARFPAEALDGLEERAGALCARSGCPRRDGRHNDGYQQCDPRASRACAATGSVVAMHMEQLFILLKFGTTPALRRVVEELVDKQLLIANANSEVGIGGDVMRSIAALEPEGDGWRFDKQALAASFGREADMILSTSRRSPDAADTDQALCLLRTADFTLEPTSGWDTLGLRGTCSSGLHMTGHVAADDLFPASFSEIGARAAADARQRHDNDAARPERRIRLGSRPDPETRRRENRATARPASCPCAAQSACRRAAIRCRSPASQDRRR